MKYDVFLSYAREDLSAVKTLVGAIEAEGLTVFWDRHIQLGQQWSDILEQALRESRVVVVVWSAASVKSTWVKAEATEAMARRRLIPVRIDQATIPIPFGQVQTADISLERPLREQGVSIAAAIAALADDGIASAGIAAHPTPVAALPTATARTLDWRHAFLSMDGRLGRRDYWICYLALNSISALLLLLVESLVGATAPGATLDTKMKAAGFSFIITLYFQVALFLKRLHDFGWSGWWTLPAALVALFAAASSPWVESALPYERITAWFFKLLVWAIVIAAGARAGHPGCTLRRPSMPPGDRQRTAQA